MMETLEPHQGESSTTLKRIRKGTKSCIECRQRKIKCIWPDGDRLCAGCKTRGKQCVPQIYQKRAPATDRVTSRDRISRLEQQIANIAAAVHDKGSVGGSSLPSVSPYNNVNDVDAMPEGEEGNDPSIEGPANDAPSHLKFLFESSLIGPSQRFARSSKGPPEPPCSPQYLASTRARLQRLIPSKADVEAVVPFAAKWMELYTGLFPALLNVFDLQLMVDMHEHISGPAADPNRIAMFLMLFAMTARQLPLGQDVLSFKDIRAFAMDVLSTIESTIISHNGYAATVEGLSTTMMHCRLQVGLGKIRPVWLTLRRTLALAEIIGLPRSCYQQSSEADNDPQAQERLALWDTICATDRLSSMLFNLPAATASHRLPRKKVTDENGSVITQALMFEIATLAMRIQDIDESSIRNEPASEIYDKVLSLDKDLRALKASTPAAWWTVGHTLNFRPDHLIQFWFSYVNVRAHLRMAMSKDEHDQYAYSRTACFDAAKSSARMYAFARPKIPAGFFACRIIDMQIFSVLVFLLLTSFDSTAMSGSASPSKSAYRDETRVALVQTILETMDSVSDTVGADFAREAASAFRGLQAIMNSSSQHNHPEGVTLKIPLLGKIHVGGQRNRAETAPQASHGHAAFEQQQQLQSPQQDQQHPTSSFAQYSDTQMPATTGNYAYAQQQQSTFNTPYISDFGSANLPWMLELDLNSSSLQDPYIVDGDFDGFAGIGGNVGQWMDTGYGSMGYGV